MSLKNKILDTIEEKEITPKPEWRFTLHSVLLWFSIGLSVLLGGLALSIIIFFSLNGDWDVLLRLPDRVRFLLFTLPYAWLMVTVAALIFAQHQFRLTKDGYRFRYSFTILGIVVATGALGYVFYHTGVGQILDARLQSLPGYGQLINPRVALWNMTEEGRLAGDVIEIDGEVFKVRDSSQKIWTVSFEEGAEFQAFVLKEGRRIRVLGTLVSPDEFRAKRILPWIPREVDRHRVKGLRLPPPPPPPSSR